MDRAEQAVQNRKMGCNCCQAVLTAFEDLVPFDFETLKSMGAALGGGMATGEGPCGALCGAEMILGLAASGTPEVRSKARAVFESFRDTCGATVCRELKGVGTGRMLCSCEDCVRQAVRALEGVLEA